MKLAASGCAHLTLCATFTLSLFCSLSCAAHPSTEHVHGCDPTTCACRLKVYKAFKEGQKRILVATDLVGRGIDIERVNIVINYDMPETDERHGNGADTYLHRVRDHPESPPF